MPKTPLGIGCAAAQERFLRENQAFVHECEEIFSLVHKIFIRTLVSPSPEEEQRIEHLPDDSAPAKEFFNKVMAERSVFYLGRIAADDFSELLTLAGNGYGLGALKSLRSVYEHTVSAELIAKNPSESENFADDSAIKR